jgi:hypothetical protein
MKSGKCDSVDMGVSGTVRWWYEPAKAPSSLENGLAEFVSVHVESFVSLGYALSNTEVLQIAWYLGTKDE